MDNHIGILPQSGVAGVRRRIAVTLALVLTLVLVAAAAVYAGWTYLLGRESMESTVLAESRTLATEIMASWEYVSDIQPRINYNADGSYDFKGVYCSIAGKSIAQRFTNRSGGYSIRFTRDQPRSAVDAPDEFESAALAAFSESGAGEYYAVCGQGDDETFRYVAALTIDEACLSCHGEPAGVPDELGFLREGMALGDLAGAVSIEIPLKAYALEAQNYAVRTIAFFVALALAIALIVWLALRKLVTEPIGHENEQLQAANDAKSDMLAMVSHELRTPLSSIIAFADVWSKDVRHDDPDERELVDEIRRNSEVLLAMVNNTIDTARLDAGRYELSIDQVDFDDLMGGGQCRGAPSRPETEYRLPLYSRRRGAGRPVRLGGPAKGRHEHCGECAEIHRRGRIG